MKQIKVGYRFTLDVSTLSDADIAKLVVLLSKLKEVESTGDNIEGEWVSAFYYSGDNTVQLSNADGVAFSDYKAAKAHLHALKAEAEEGRLSVEAA